MHTSSSGQVAPLLTCGFLVAGFISYIPLAPDPGPIAFGGACTVLALAAVLLLMRSTQRGDTGGAVAWGYSGLPLIVLLILIALPLAHLSRLLGNQTCDPFAGDCGPVPLGSPLPLAFYLAALVAGWNAVRGVKKSSRAKAES